MVFVVSLVSSLTYSCKLCILCHTWALYSLHQWFSAFLIVQPFIQFFMLWWTTKIKLFFLLIYTLILLLSWIINIWYAQYLIWNPKGMVLHAYLGSHIISRALLTFLKSICPPVITEDLCFWQPSSNMWLNSVVEFPLTYMTPQD